jgi:hypothetical protein
LRFPSLAGPGVNLVVYRDCCARDALKIENEAALRAVIAPSQVQDRLNKLEVARH